MKKKQQRKAKPSPRAKQRKRVTGGPLAAALRAEVARLERLLDARGAELRKRVSAAEVARMEHLLEVRDAQVRSQAQQVIDQRAQIAEQAETIRKMQQEAPSVATAVEMLRAQERSWGRWDELEATARRLLAMHGVPPMERDLGQCLDVLEGILARRSPERAEAWVVYEDRLDSLENHLSLALTQEPIGIALSEDGARQAVAAGGTHSGCQWPPVLEGSPRRSMKRLPIV